MVLINGISSMATRSLLAELAKDWSNRERHLQFESVGGVDATRRVMAGEVFDLVVLAADAMDRLAAAGHLLADSRRDVAASPMAIAAHADAPMPDVGSGQALREAVQRARRIGYSTGPSGVALIALFERWGLTADLDGRLVQARPGVPVGALIADGAVDLGFQQLSELQGVDGVQVLGPMPPGLEIVTVFSGAVGSGSAQAAEARSALDYLCSVSVIGVKFRHSMTGT